MEQLPPDGTGRLVLEQSSPRAIVQFAALDVAAGEAIEIRTAAPGAVTIVRVVGTQPSVVAVLAASGNPAPLGILALGCALAVCGATMIRVRRVKKT